MTDMPSPIVTRYYWSTDQGLPRCYADGTFHRELQLALGPAAPSQFVNHESPKVRFAGAVRPAPARAPPPHPQNGGAPLPSDGAQGRRRIAQSCDTRLDRHAG